MKIHLMRISPLDLGWSLGIVGLILSVPIVFFAFMAIGPGRTVTLSGFITLTFKGSLEPIGLVIAFPLLNAIVGFITGLVTAWIYNGYAYLFGGISFTLGRAGTAAPETPTVMAGSAQV